MPLQSFIEIASGSDFPLENLPFGIFKPRVGHPRAGVALGEFVVDLSVLEAKGHLSLGQDGPVFTQGSLNGFLTLDRPPWKQARQTLQGLLTADTPTLR